MKSLHLAPFFVFIVLSKNIHAADIIPYDQTNLPKLPEWADGSYQIDVDSISPNQEWAILVPQDPQNLGNCLIHLPDFTNLLELPTIAIFADKFKEHGLVVNWAKDNSAAVAYSHGKFGAENIYIVVPGSPGYVIDLEHEIRREMQADFIASKAEEFNGNYDYFLDYGAGNSWKINAADQVIVDCEGDNNPRLHSIRSWKGRFEGLYDIRTEKFVTKKYERIYVRNYDPD